MNDKIIKFGKAKKQLLKTKKETQAAENRVKFGRTKAEKLRDKKRKNIFIRHIDNHDLKDK